MMVFGMPAVTFFAILSWPFVFVVAAFVTYGIMKKQDALVDDSEFEKGMKGRGGDKK